MPNQITSAGLETKTNAELVSEFTADMEAIYGSDINLDSDTPDGQMMNIFIQAVLDVLDLLTQVYNMFDPDNAIGTVLDQRVAINGIQRQAGTFTITDITVVTSQALNLFGLDQSDEEIFTIQDNAGNEFQLETTQLGVTPGSHSYSFRSAVPGAVLTIPNTITIPVTVVLGVTSVNNPSVATVIGLNEESDAALKIRRQLSVSIASQGYLAGLRAALLNISGITDAFIYENTDDTADSDGVPGHSIWVIVRGTYTAQLVAEAIYSKRNAGCGMFGDIDYVITQVDDTPFVVKWDDVESEDLYIKFTATSLDGINPPNVDAIRQGLVTSFIPGVNEQVNINDLATAVQAIDENCLVTSAGFSLSSGGSFTNTLSPTSKKQQFVVTEANIIIIPMIMSPSSAAVASLATQQFEAFGGFGSYAWTMDSNPSGGSVNPTTGLYTAGAGTGTDVVRATDGQGNFVTANIVVT